jgi:hypothetical protein
MNANRCPSTHCCNLPTTTVQVLYICMLTLHTRNSRKRRKVLTGVVEVMPRDGTAEQRVSQGHFRFRPSNQALPVRYLRAQQWRAAMAAVNVSILATSSANRPSSTQEAVHATDWLCVLWQSFICAAISLPLSNPRGMRPRSRAPWPADYLPALPPPSRRHNVPGAIGGQHVGLHLAIIKRTMRSNPAEIARRRRP